MIQTIILFIAIYVFILAIYNTIRKCRELNHAMVLEHSFMGEMIFMAISLTYIIWYCN